jgi:hypothetical protein
VSWSPGRGATELSGELGCATSKLEMGVAGAQRWGPGGGASGLLVGVWCLVFGLARILRGKN